MWLLFMSFSLLWKLRRRVNARSISGICIIWCRRFAEKCTEKNTCLQQGTGWRFQVHYKYWTYPLHIYQMLLFLKCLWNESLFFGCLSNLSPWTQKNILCFLKIWNSHYLAKNRQVFEPNLRRTLLALSASLVTSTGYIVRRPHSALYFWLQDKWNGGGS